MVLKVVMMVGVALVWKVMMMVRMMVQGGSDLPVNDDTLAGGFLVAFSVSLSPSSLR